MDLSFLINNPIVNFIGGAVGASILKFIYDAYKLKDIVAKGEAGLGNAAGLAAKKYLVDTIKDPQLKEITKQNLKDAPNNYDYGWDLGLDGQKI